MKDEGMYIRLMKAKHFTWDENVSWCMAIANLQVVSVGVQIDSTQATSKNRWLPWLFSWMTRRFVDCASTLQSYCDAQVGPTIAMTAGVHEIFDNADEFVHCWQNLPQEKITLWYLTFWGDWSAYVAIPTRRRSFLPYSKHEVYTPFKIKCLDTSLMSWYIITSTDL